ncbi:FecR family protein [Chitinophaga sp. GCM10012297]|uniref:FecR domain-containing protein n=1 Tax=Chitinophaga chungangae TaxID=2821488 RepID=A0ABS3YFY8_9BACT|nr:FecR family protein [Chitinophaga chungangae]MBO9153598.1 FecR domain-containing protein [Chitinophaga chungangae]
MIENNDQIIRLIGKYLETSLDDGERRILDEWLNAAEDNRRLFRELTDPQQVSRELRRFYAYNSERIAQKIGGEIPAFAAPAPAPVHRLHFLRRWGWAAAAVLLLGAGTWYFTTQQQTNPSPATVAAAEISPGREGAILTLSDGRQVVLDSLANGTIAQQQGTDVVLSNGQLTYNDDRSDAPGIAYNTMTTPRGRQFRITLPDGTRVWLNAASSIRYPVAFTGKERKVDITGEVFFEVSKDASKPFLVNATDEVSISVLGTSFNINAYDNEKNIAATLLTGAVKVTVPGNSKAPVLRPGQQASINRASGQMQVLQAEPDRIMAWKNGLFNFEGAGIEDVMRQLERWYDIRVVYENGIPDITFLGEIDRQIALPDLLEILRRTDVDFRIEGRTLIVLNN